MGLIKGHPDKLLTKVCVAQRNYQVIHYNYIKHKFVSMAAALYDWEHAGST